MKTRVISPGRFLLCSGAGILLGLQLGNLLWGTGTNYMGPGLGVVAAMVILIVGVWVNAPRST